MRPEKQDDYAIEMEHRPTNESIASSRASEKSSIEVTALSGDAFEKTYVEGLKLALILVSATIVYFLMMLDMSILATAIPYITNEFNSLVDVGWYGSAYQLCSASLQPLTGKIFSRLSSKWSYIVFLLVFQAGSAICGSASSSPALIIGRAVAGLGSSGLMNGGLTILNSCVPPPKQPALLGIMMALGYLGIAFGPLVGGALTEYVSWRWCFYINLPIAGSVTFLLIYLSIPDNIPKPGWRFVMRRPLHEFDLIGFALFAPATIQFFLALQYGGNQFAWNSATVIGLFCGAGTTFLVWLAWDFWQGDQAMIPFSILKRRIVWTSCVTGLFFAGSIFITGYYLPIYFQSVRGASPLKSGVYILPNILPQMLVTMLIGKQIERLGYYLPFMLICGVLNAIASGLLSLLSPSTPTGKWVGYQILLGIGRGFGLSVPIIAIQNNSLSASHIPIAMSLLVFCQNFGGAIMVSLSQTIFTNSLHDTIPVYAPSITNPDTAAAAGLTTSNLKGIVTDSELPGLLKAYSVALDRIFYLCAGIAVASWVFSWGMGWTDIRISAREKREEQASSRDIQA